MSRWKSRKEVKGRGAWLPQNILRCPAVATLPNLTHRVVVAAAAECGGPGTNGDISLAAPTLERYGIARGGHTAEAIKELVARGLLIVTRQGSRGRCTLYGLPWWPLSEDAHIVAKLDKPLPRLPDMTFMRWKIPMGRPVPHTATPGPSNGGKPVDNPAVSEHLATGRPISDTRDCDLASHLSENTKRSDGFRGGARDLANALSGERTGK